MRSVTFLWQLSSGPENFSDLVLLAYTVCWRLWRWHLAHFEVVFVCQVAQCNIRLQLKDDSFMELRGEIRGPPDTPYADATFILDIVIPDTYPFNPPKVPLLHCVYFVTQRHLSFCCKIGDGQKDCHIIATFAVFLCLWPVCCPSCGLPRQYVFDLWHLSAALSR